MITPTYIVDFSEPRDLAVAYSNFLREMRFLLLADPGLTVGDRVRLRVNLPDGTGVNIGGKVLQASPAGDWYILSLPSNEDTRWLHDRARETEQRMRRTMNHDAANSPAQRKPQPHPTPDSPPHTSAQSPSADATTGSNKQAQVPPQTTSNSPMPRPSEPHAGSAAATVFAADASQHQEPMPHLEIAPAEPQHTSALALGSDDGWEVASDEEVVQQEADGLVDSSFSLGDTTTRAVPPDPRDSDLFVAPEALPHPQDSAELMAPYTGNDAPHDLEEHVRDQLHSHQAPYGEAQDHPAPSSKAPAPTTPHPLTPVQHPAGQLSEEAPLSANEALAIVRDPMTALDDIPKVLARLATEDLQQLAAPGKLRPLIAGFVHRLLRERGVES